RQVRYQLAERLRRARDLDWVASGHTRTDLAETVIYRLATSPGRRALLGLRAQRGCLIRPLLGVDRDRLRALVREAALPFRDDPTNAEPRFARNRIRNEVLPVLREIGPALEATIAETQAELTEEGDSLDRLASEALDTAGADIAGAIGAQALAELEPALRRLALRTLAERAAGHPVPLGRERTAEIVRLAGDPEGGVVELGGGVEARIEAGYVRFSAAAERATLGTPEAILSVPGSCRFGGWEVRAEVREGPIEPSGAEAAWLDLAGLSGVLVVRGWRDGDRMRPLGLDGTKSLQDLFTDRKVPRSLRRSLPVVTSGDRIAWIAGVAVSDEFAAGPGSERTAVLAATRRSTD
ncbi:MAG: tRNA lysidine(34) synthetase TilS, partial [Actinomycetota bacterium]|nr:tRNA lysidine(34) synthetase TilS [Actinomycetota bacterium]